MGSGREKDFTAPFVGSIGPIEQEDRDIVQFANPISSGNTQAPLLFFVGSNSINQSSGILEVFQRHESGQAKIPVEIRRTLKQEESAIVQGLEKGGVHAQCPQAILLQGLDQRMGRVERFTVQAFDGVPLFPIISPHLPNQIGSGNNRNIETQTQASGIKNVDTVLGPIFIVGFVPKSAGTQSVTSLIIVANANEFGRAETFDFGRAIATRALIRKVHLVVHRKVLVFGGLRRSGAVNRLGLGPFNRT